jgi:hypothetical protein
METTTTKLYITGNTYPVKDQLRAMGARWDADAKAWYCMKADIQAKAQALVGTVPAKTGGETKRCWECGNTFTYADAKANNGDWKDSYCGC